MWQSKGIATGTVAETKRKRDYSQFLAFSTYLISSLVNIAAAIAPSKLRTGYLYSQSLQFPQSSPFLCGGVASV